MIISLRLSNTVRQDVRQHRWDIYSEVLWTFKRYVSYIGVVGKKNMADSTYLRAVISYMYIVHTRPACCNYFLNLRRDEICPNSKFQNSYHLYLTQLKHLFLCMNYWLLYVKSPFVCSWTCCAVHTIFFSRNISRYLWQSGSD